MAEYFQPPGAPFDFQFTDGQQNLIARREGGSTVGTGLQTLVTLPIVPNLFSIDNQKLAIFFMGNFNGAAGTKRIRVNFDATTVLETGLLAQNNSNYKYEIHVARRFTSNLAIRGDLSINIFTGNLVAVATSGKADLLGSIDFTIAHTITVICEVSAGADSVTVEEFIASLL